MTAILLRHPAFVPTLEYARAEYDRSLAYLRFVLNEGHGDPDHPRRVDAAYARRDQALRDRHAAEGWQPYDYHMTIDERLTGEKLEPRTH